MGLVIDRALTSLYQVRGDFYVSRVLSFVGKRERERDIDTMFLEVEHVIGFQWFL